MSQNNTDWPCLSPSAWNYYGRGNYTPPALARGFLEVLDLREGLAAREAYFHLRRWAAKDGVQVMTGPWANWWNQVDRSCLSIGLNVAEAWGRYHTRESQYLVARGSAFETLVALLLYRTAVGLTHVDEDFDKCFLCVIEAVKFIESRIKKGFSLEEPEEAKTADAAKPQEAAP